MAVSKAQKKATAAYIKRSVKIKQLRFYPGEYELYEWVNKQEKQNAYIKDLIRKDMENSRK